MQIEYSQFVWYTGTSVNWHSIVDERRRLLMSLFDELSKGFCSKKGQANEILSQEEYKDKFLYAKNNDIDNAIESIKQGYENSEIPQVIIDKLVQIANG